MKKIAVILIVALVIVLLPAVGFTEDQNTVRLAKVIYAMAGDASYSVKVAVGSVVVNRVENPWFPATVEGVLTEKHQFPAGDRYDDASLDAAHEVMSGGRNIDHEVVYVCMPDGTAPKDSVECVNIDGYSFRMMVEE